MVAYQNQDFVTYQGDTVKPIFTVLDSAGNAVDISTVSDIGWSAKRGETDSAAVSKTKAAGQIAFVTDGTDGKFQVTILAADTAAMSGFYFHAATLTDASGEVTTVSAGRMQVGVKPLWTFDPNSILTVPLYFVRDLIGDTLNNDQLLTDAQVEASISTWPGSMYLAAADCCRKIAAKCAREVDTLQGELRIAYSSKTKRYSQLAVDMMALAAMQSPPVGFAGGISKAQKTDSEQDTDRVPPQFVIGMTDNLIPFGELGGIEYPGTADPLTVS